MTVGLLHRLDGWSRDLLPTLTTVLFLVLSTVRIPVAGFRTVAPAIVLIAVYHWTVHRPLLLPPAVIFVVGFVQDLLSGSPIGTGSLTLLAVYLAVLSQRRFLAGKPFPMVWLGFALVAAVTFFALWAVVSALSGVLLDPREAAFRGLVTIACYPLFAGLLLGLQRAFMSRH
ncbi:rod shape-determining protein MreD [Stella sp.]|uniref:rod shape-determining protein MreD n=1 Tax=Stella sp. TaxID=2912054 RepID=UPI0035B43848